MNPLATIGTSLGFSLLTKWWEKRQADKLPEVPDFSPTQIIQFTRVIGQFRSFSLDTNQVTLAILGSRSVVPQKHPVLESYGQVWKVVPLQAGLRTALDVVLEGHRNPNMVVVGSHTLALLPIGSPLPMVIVVGPPQAQLLAAKEGVISQPDGTKPAGKFALIQPVPFAEAEASAPAPAPQPTVGAPAAAAAPAPTPQTAAEPNGVEAAIEAGTKKLEKAALKNGASKHKGEPAIVAEATVTTEK